MKCKMCGEMPCMCHGGKMKMAEGGEAESMDMPMEKDMGEETDNELMDMCCEELQQAFEKKDKKQMLDALKAIWLSTKE